MIAASGGSDDKSFLWSLESGEKISDLGVHGDSCSAVAFSSDGKYVASGGMDVCLLQPEIHWLQWNN